MASVVQVKSVLNFPQDRSAMMATALEPVLEELGSVRKALMELLPVETSGARLIAEHVFGAGGKMVRPAMFLLCSRLLSYRGPHLIPVATVCEYVHTASLLHDDVVDSSPLRRNKPTANKLWGDEAAVLTGDLIYSTASELMAETGKLELVKTFARAIRKMSEGELLHLDHLYSFSISREEYFQIISGKTAVLMGAACKSAAILSEASPEQIAALETFGHDLGMAFQLIDDALDYLGSESLTGKAVLADFSEGKVTLPVILLQDRASGSEKSEIRGLLEQKNIDHKGVERISALVRSYGTASDTLELAGNFTDQATQALRNHFEAGPLRSHLENLAGTLLLRSY